MAPKEVNISASYSFRSQSPCLAAQFGWDEQLQVYRSTFSYFLLMKPAELLQHQTFK